MGLIVSSLLSHTKGGPGVPYLELVLAFNAAVYALHTYLDVRQLRVRASPFLMHSHHGLPLGHTALCSDRSQVAQPSNCQPPSPAGCDAQAIRLPLPPKELRDVSDPKEFNKTQAYQRDKWWFSLVQGAFGFTLSSGLLYFMYLPGLWRAAARAVAALGLAGEVKARPPPRPRRRLERRQQCVTSVHLPVAAGDALCGAAQRAAQRTATGRGRARERPGAGAGRPRG